ncbi:WNT16 protein, partial [Atractosteus spatula]|nr:WNT16 protein [Atractosteus spatula]
MEKSAKFGIHRLCIFLILFFSFLPFHSQGSWMWLGITSLSIPEKMGCGNLPLTNKQKDLCKRKPYLLPSIKEGARMGISECQTQFKYERWNCSTTSEFSVFGYELTSGNPGSISDFTFSAPGLCIFFKVLPFNTRHRELIKSNQPCHPAIYNWTGTKETAFIYAVMAAGLVHTVTRSCSAGNMTECSCDTTLQGGGSPREGWHWGGCSDDIQYGMWFSRRFLDSATGNASALLAMNQHNSEAGRQAVAKMMSTDCRCHGVSGSCAVKTCWKTMSTFEKVGSFLKDRYENSIQVLDRSRKKVRRKEKDQRRVPVSKEELIYVNKSPNYCLEDRKAGIAGTRGRKCNRTSAGPDGCNLLCCGRGYNTHVVRHVERCECKFVWCCYVRCRRCESMTDMHTCK